MRDDVTTLKQLGSQQTNYHLASPHAGMLETFPNQYANRDYLIRHETAEFTSLCPRTGQPDFASVVIEYIADRLCVETKSLKLYLFAYRGEGSFMETICNRVLEDLVTTMSPRRCTVRMRFSPRGGIATEIVAEYVKG